MSISIEFFEEQTRLHPFFSGVDDFCKQHLPPDTAREEEDGGAKTFADPVEHYATLASWEVAIVDTPLFQRLRTIRQLGLAYLIYPTLGYSRFEHTIGVTARLAQVVRGLEENRHLGVSRARLPSLPTDEQLAAARLACLLHDVGHCLFSHVSEAVIEQLPGDGSYPASKEILNAFEEYAGRRIPIAEAFAVAVLMSPSVIKYLGTLEIPGAKRNRAKLAAAAAHLVLGLPIPDDPHSLFLAQLMSSGLDVDKLDYMLRESHFTGITLGVSFDWLLKKLSVRSVSAARVPEGLKPRIKYFSAESTFAVLSLDHGGQFAFEEFCIARLALHEKIYLHQKIRAAEAEMKEALKYLPVITPPFRQAHRWLFLKEAMMEFPEIGLPTLPPQGQLFEESTERTSTKLELSRIGARRLTYRAFGFGWQNAVAEPLLEDYRDAVSPTDRLMAFIEQDPAGFLDRVRANLSRIKGLLPKGEYPDESGMRLFVDLPRLSSIQQGHDSIYFEHPSRLPVRWTMPIDKIVEYYHRNRALGFVFSTKQHIPFVLLAAERAVWDLFKVIYVQDVCVSLRTLERVRGIKDSLHRKKYYDDTPELQPVSEFLNSVDAQDAIARIAKKLALYDPRSKRYVSPASVTTFVSQFPSDLQEACLHWLATIDWVTPSDHIETVLTQIAEREPIGSGKRVGFCPLGASTDSATRIAYNLRNTEDRFMILPLTEALGRKLDAYILYDDNINTGKQALNIVGAWLGKKLPQDLRLEEQHVVELSEEDKLELLRKPVVVIFAVGIEGAVEKLVEQLTSLCDFDGRLISATVGKVLTLQERIFSGSKSRFQHQKKTRLMEFVREVAKSMFMDEGKKAEIAEERALGYAGAEAMIVFPYNCPTMTVPALWLAGKYNGKQWVPLIERTRRSIPQTGQLTGEDA